MKKGVFHAIFFLLLVFQQDAIAQKDPDELFLQIKELSISDPDLAEKKVKEYIQIGKSTKDEKIAANSFYLLGRINYFKSRNYISNKYYAQAINSKYARQEPSFAESCYNNMGVNYEMQNLLPEAMEAYQKSLQYAERLKDSISIGQSWINIALLNAKVRKYEQARQLTKKALQFFSRKQDLLNMALCYQNLGYILSEEQNHSVAIQYYFKCLNLNRKVGNQFEILNLMFNIGSNYGDLYMFQKSEQYLAETMQLALAQDRQDVIAKIYIQRGENATKSERYGQAEMNFKNARKVIDQHRVFELKPLLLASFTDLYAKSGNFVAYQQVVKEFQDNEKKRTFAESITRSDEVQALYEFEKNVHQIRSQTKDIETNRTQAYILAGLSAFLGIVLTVFVFQHLKARKYMRSLFESQVEKTLYHFNEAVTANRNYLKDIYEKIIAFTENSADRDIDLQILSRKLSVREEHVAQSIRMFGKNDQKHTFFRTFFIDELCKQLIHTGGNISLRNVVDDSPFLTLSDFNRHFREVTGLKPGQFIHYCDARLKGKGKSHS